MLHFLASVLLGHFLQFTDDRLIEGIIEDLQIVTRVNEQRRLLLVLLLKLVHVLLNAICQLLEFRAVPYQPRTHAQFELMLRESCFQSTFDFLFFPENLLDERYC